MDGFLSLFQVRLVQMIYLFVFSLQVADTGRRDADKDMEPWSAGFSSVHT